MVTISWAQTEGGDSITELDHESIYETASTDVQELYISHDGDHRITNCRLYLAPYSNEYSGSFSPLQDYNELLSWGDSSISNSFGGVQVNMNSNSSFPDSSWPTVTNKHPSNGFVFCNSIGKDLDSAVTLTTAAGIANEGIIEVDEVAHIAMRIQVPQIDTPGVRQFDTKLRFWFTS